MRRSVRQSAAAGGARAAGSARAVRPDVVIAPSIGSEHSRSFATLEATRAEKAAMGRALSASGVAVPNGDDANAMWMASATHARVVTFGFSAGCDARAADFRLRAASDARCSSRGGERAGS
jgi:UDP-N-acetylmuramyl pentapeptide synthase